MQIQFLGTGAGQPSKARNVSSLALKLLDEVNQVWLFDCGEGTQNQILETTIRPRKVAKSLSLTCTETIFLDCQVFYPVVLSSQVRSRLILIFTVLLASVPLSWQV